MAIKDKEINKRKKKRILHYYANDNNFSQINVEIPVEFKNKIVCGDSLEVLKKLPDNCIDLVFTSPPYNFGKSYNEYDDNSTNSDYFKQLFDILSETARIVKYGGRIIINVMPLYSDFIPTHHIITNWFIQQKWIWRDEIIWEKNQRNCAYSCWGCYSDKVRVVTNKGLKYFKDVNINTDLFPTLNLDTNEIEYQKAFDYIEKDYTDEYLYKIKNNTFDMEVTPNHNILTTDGLHPLEDIVEKHGFTIPQKIGMYNGGTAVESFVLPTYIPDTPENFTQKELDYFNQDIIIPMNDWIKFLGIYLGDGCVYINDDNKIEVNIPIYKSKEKNVEKIKELLSTLPFKFEYQPYTHEYIYANERLLTYLEQLEHEKKIPSFIEDLPIEQVKLFLEWLIICNGSIENEKWGSFTTPSKDFFNSMINLLIKCGIRFSSEIKKGHYVNNILVSSNLPLYVVNYITSEKYFINKKDVSKIPYDGKVYCVSVPNKTLMVELNGKYTWCGNSYRSSSSPFMKHTQEFIEVYSKGNIKHDIPNHKDQDDMQKTEFSEWVKNGVWSLAAETQMKNFGHPAMFPERLAYRAIKLFSGRGDTVLDIFNGCGTTTKVAKEHGRNYLGIDIDETYCNIAQKRTDETVVQEFELIETEKTNIDQKK